MENKQSKQAPMPHGPRGRKQMGPMPKLENPGKLVKRLLAYVLKKYWFHYLIVIVCIIVSALVNVQGFLFLGTLIDKYIKPFIGRIAAVPMINVKHVYLILIGGEREIFYKAKIISLRLVKRGVRYRYLRILLKEQARKG